MFFFFFSLNQTQFFLLVGPTLSKEEKELERRKELKKIRVKYGLQVRELNIVTCIKLCIWFCIKLPVDKHSPFLYIKRELFRMILRFM